MPPVRAAIPTSPDVAVPDRIVVDEEGDILEPIRGGVVVNAPPALSPERRDMGLLLVALGLIAGLLCMALELAAVTRLVAVARVVLLAVGCCAIAGRALTAHPDPARPHWFVVVLAPLLGVLVATWALLSGPADVSSRASFLSGTLLTVSALNLFVVGSAARAVRLARAWIRERLSVPARRVTGEPTQLSPKEIVSSVAVGEHVVVEVGETVPVDLEIIEGEVEVTPWVGAATRQRRRPGDVVVATSRVTQGQLRGRCIWTGDDRAIARPVLAASRRADVHGQVPRLSRHIAERWAFVVAAAIAIGLAVVGKAAIEVAMVTVAVYGAIANIAVGAFGGLAVARGVRAALRRGVIYNDASAWERCARVTTAVFCARGTLVRGEPELVEVEVFETRAGKVRDAEQVLALAGGALAGEGDPVAVAVRRAVQDRGLSPEPVRNIRGFAGLGVAAVVASGDGLCVGGSALMLERRISVAAAAKRVYELEAAGRTVVLVAVGDRLVGLLALQDGLRSGARAAVQHLLDARIEPVLMSADTRETCEALGRALDVDHLRPEVLAEERRAAVERIRDGGGTVAVLGHSPHDDEALAAADTAVVLAAAGRERDDFAVTLVSDDVRDGALALAMAQHTRAHAQSVLALVLVPALFGALVVTIGLLPPEYAPLAQLVGAVAAAWHLHRYDRATAYR
jgi:P-type Cu+ transporter